MGHVCEKSDTGDSTGENDPAPGQDDRVRGQEDFRNSTIHEEHIRGFAFAQDLAGSLQGKRVLDLGFGRGDIIPLLLGAGIESYLGIDCSSEALESASTRFKDPRLQFRQMDAIDLGEENAFDLILLFDTLEHIPVYEADLLWPALHRALRPGGCVALSSPIVANPNAPEDTAKMAGILEIPCHKQTWGTLARAMLRHGFTPAKTADRLIGGVRTQDLPQLEPARREAFLAGQAELLARHGITQFDGRLTPEIERKLVPGPGRIVFGCVSDQNPKYLNQALRLIQSVRWFGGQMAGVNCFVGVVDGADAETTRKFEALGAFVRTIPRFDARHPYSNMLGLLDLPELTAYDTLMLMNCDTVVVQDPWPYLDGEVFQCKPADVATVSPEEFQRIFNHFGLPCPAETMRSNPAGTPMIWYINVGVMILPNAILRRIGPAWIRFNRALLDRLDLLDRTTYCDQASLAVAYAADSVPFRELPLAMNFPTHISEMGFKGEIDTCEPVIFHYHDRVHPDGLLHDSPHEGAQRTIRKYNDQVRRSRGEVVAPPEIPPTNGARSPINALRGLLGRMWSRTIGGLGARGAKNS